MRINDDGLQLVKESEGLCLNAYLDAVGVPTIGYGHTNNVKMGQTITKEQADKFLLEDIKWAEDAVSNLVSVELTENQFSALVCFVFNVGQSAFAESTLLKLLNAKDYKGAAAQFSRWNKADGKELPGLTTRRTNEMNLFLKKSSEPTKVPTPEVRDYWLLVCPSNNPAKAKKLNQNEALMLESLLPDMANNLGIPLNIDVKNKKIYFGKGKVEEAFVSKQPKNDFRVTLRPGDLHFICSGRQRNMSCYNSLGKKLFSIPCLMEGIYGTYPPEPSWKTNSSDTPPGVWKITQVERISPPEAPYGYGFSYLQPISGECARVTRSGIGIHGGGSNSPNPFADEQGYYETQGCIRLSNKDNRETFMPVVEKALAASRICWLTTVWD